jgi:hypothetical protein
VDLLTPRNGSLTSNTTCTAVDRSKGLIGSFEFRLDGHDHFSMSSVTDMTRPANTALAFQNSWHGGPGVMQMPEIGWTARTTKSPAIMMRMAAFFIAPNP